MATKTTSSKNKTTKKTTKKTTVGVSSKKKGTKGTKTSTTKKKTTFREYLAALHNQSAKQRAEEERTQKKSNRQSTKNFQKSHTQSVLRQQYLKKARKVGNWGETIWFEVSSDKQLTFRNFNKTHSARWSDHEVIGKKPLSEFGGPDLVSLTMSCTFSVSMNVNPREIMTALEKALENGTVDYLYIKERKIGSYKMKLENISEAYDVVLINGAIAKATVDLTFSEYVTKSYKHGKKVAGTKVPWEFLVGEKPTFTGGKVYKSNSAKKGKKKAAAKVKVSKYQKGKAHPYYVKTVAAKGWKGWVDEGTLKA